MLERLEKIFREMNRAPGLDGTVRSALLGLQEMIEDCRARIVPQSFELTHRLGACGLEPQFILIQEPHHKVLQTAQESGQTQLEATGVVNDQCGGYPFFP